MEPADVSMRVVADHLRAMTFLIADGVVPSNEWRGYVLRKIMRRAMRHGRKLGLHEPFLFSLVDVLVREMGDAYPELKAGRDAVVQVVRSEEERFDAVLTGGLPRLEEALERAAKGSRVLPGDEAFKLYDTYGLPRDFIEDLASNQGLQFDAEGFAREMEGQREKARAKSSFDGRKGEDFTFGADGGRATLGTTGDVFEGYTETRLQGVPVVALFDDAKQQVDALAAGESGWAVLARTPFYVEAGGQVSDQGWIETAAGRSRVSGVVRLGAGLPRAHRVEQAASAHSHRRTRHRRSGRHLARCDAPQPHRHAPAPLGAPSGARPARQAGGLAGGAGPPALRLRPLQRGLRRRPPPHRGHRQSGDPEERDGDHRGPRYPGSHRRRRDGALRREVRRQGARGVHRRRALQHGALWRHARARHRRHRAVAHHRGGRRRGGCAPHRGGHRAGGARLRTAAAARVRTRPIVPQRREPTMWSPGSRRGCRRWRRRSRIATGSWPRPRPATPAARRSASPSATSRSSAAAWTMPARTCSARIADQIKSTLTSGVVFLAGPTADGKVAMVASVTGNVSGRLKAGQLVKELAPIVGGGGGGRPDFAEAGGKDPAQVDAMLAAAPEVVQRLLGA